MTDNLLYAVAVSALMVLGVAVALVWLTFPFTVKRQLKTLIDAAAAISAQLAAIERKLDQSRDTNRDITSP